MKANGFIYLIVALLVYACTNSSHEFNNKSIPMIEMDHNIVNQTLDSLKLRYNNPDVQRVEKSIGQMAALWTDKDGSAPEFISFCLENYTNDEKEREALFKSISDKFELITGSFHKIDVGLKEPLHMAGNEPDAIDMEMGGYDVSAHFKDDMFSNKLAFTVILNFPAYNLQEKQQFGTGWTDLQWAYARLGDWFSSRIPADIQQSVSNTLTTADNYISGYNIVVGSLLNDAGETLFPEGQTLISHWGLRDELKSNYADKTNGLEKQRMIYTVMKRIITQEIPERVIDKGNVQWNPVTNKVFENGKEIQATPEPDTRYRIFLNNFLALKKADIYNPSEPTYIQRAFDGDMGFSKEEVRDMFTRFISSEQIKQVAGLVKKRLGRDLEPFDIWYDGFKSRSSISEDDLTAKTRKQYPGAKDFERDLPGIMMKLGFSPSEAQGICDKVQVDASRGAGHAWGAVMKGDKARLRTRIPEAGMDYKGYNIAMHEFGHNVEQTISLYDVDYYMMNGVPNTAFTEALAFIFQKRDLSVLGIKENNPQKDLLTTLDIFWGCYEIMGVSLVDMAAWEWLYEHPDATPAQLKENVIRIAMDIWNTYYAPVLGEKDSPVLAVYSHMIDNPLYLANYPMGHLIEFQLEEHLKGKSLATEVLRIYRMGRLAPQIWMKNATGRELSIDPMLQAAKSAAENLE
ncbi:MAG: hypothetical protein LBJ72_00700 [Dysgonamonadaceae bacterium]|jgi:hypothetical protein|nr:hypothetical protein [Dysgonamonadaceae bacterium]